jgi:hypothetical protein
MNTTEKSVKLCPTCSRPLPAGAPAGLCPACLLAQGAETESRVGGERHRFEPPTVAEVAKLFPQLEIRGLLGAGGMGSVYQARQPALDRMVALKILPQNGPGGASFEERFNREARALARLNHPNIVTVHEFGRAGTWHYFIMEFVDGANLRQLEQASRLSAREALQIIPQICDALQYAHDEGVVHRDIKPENVLVDRKGRVKIADFGLAKILETDPDTTRLTVEGQVMGTPHYMAPEQVERPLAVDHRADIYSLGVVFYEMLTGDLPIGKFAPPSRKVQVDVRLDDIVLRALENDPARRYQHASEVKQRVATVVDTPAPAAAPETAGSETDEDAPKPGVRYLRWLGIPVVVERDGERDVNFQGALTAVFVTMIVATLAHQIVRWAAGTEHALARLVWLAGLLTVVWGIRRTMNQPWDDKPQHAANGTVVLAPRSRFPYWRDALMLVGLFAFTIGSHYFKTDVIDRRFRRVLSSPLVQQQAELNPATGALVAALPGGVQVELLAIAGQAAQPDGWWLPDGTPLTGTTFSVKGQGQVTGGETNLDFIFRLTGLPDLSDVAYFDFAHSASAFGGGEVLRDGQPLSGAWPMRVVFPKSVTATKVSVGVGLEAWQTIATHSPARQTSSMMTQAGNPRWEIAFQHAADRDGHAQITVQYGPNDKRWQVRVIAVDANGRTNSPGGWTQQVEGTDYARTYSFHGLLLGEVKEFQMQARPIHEVEFPNVALRPTTPLTAPQSSLVFTAAALLTVDELVDFDVGHTADFPAAAPGENPIAGAAENVAWALEQGFDAVVGVGRLELLSVRLVPITAADWELMTPAAAEARLAAEGTSPRELRPVPDTTPAYAFRTRDGGLGLLRIVEVTDNGQKFVLQLRHAVRPGDAPRVLRAKLDPQSHTQIARLPGSGSLELLALRSAGSAAWLRPGGQRNEGIAPRFASEFDAIFGASPTLGGRRWQMLLHAEQLPAPAEHLQFKFQPQPMHLGFTSEAMVPSDGPHPGVVSLRVLWPATATNGTLWVGVPTAPWHSIGSYEPLSGSRGRTSKGNDPRRNLELHAAGVGTKGAQITVVFGTNYPRWNLRVIATRLGLAPAVGTADVSATNGPAITRTFVFPELKTLDAVQNFQVQAQPVEWVEFADLNLAAHRTNADIVSPDSFRRYSVGRSWEELGQARSLATPEQAVATFGLRLLGGEDHARVLAETTLGLPSVATNTLAYRPEAAQADRLRRQQVVSVVVYKERLAAVILAGESQGTPVFLTLVTGLQDGQWKVLPRFGSGLKTSLAAAEAGFQKNAPQLLERLLALPAVPETVPAGAAAETAADAIGSLLRSLLEATAGQK